MSNRTPSVRAPRTRGNHALASAAGTRTTGQGALTASQFVRMYHFSAGETVDAIRRGVDPDLIDALARSMGVTKRWLFARLRIARSSASRRARMQRPLPVDESARVIGLARLIGQVQTMVEESGEPAPFDPARWTAEWLERPLPALGGKSPGEFIDTAAGQDLVSNLVTRMVSGAYA